MTNARIYSSEKFTASTKTTKSTKTPTVLFFMFFVFFVHFVDKLLFSGSSQVPAQQLRDAYQHAEKQFGMGF